MIIKGIFRVALLSYSIGLLLALFEINHYSFLQNHTAHTGAPLFLIQVCTIIGFIFSLYNRKSKIAKLAMILSLTLLTNLFLLRTCNVMMGYNHWLKKGMPSKYEKCFQ